MRIVERGSLVDVSLAFRCSNCNTVFIVDRTEIKEYICEPTLGGEMLMQKWVAECPLCYQDVVMNGFRLRKESDWDIEVMRHDGQ